MRVGTDHHLTYCTNVHPGETWPEVLANLKQYLPALKARLSPNAPFGVGLRLAQAAAGQLVQGSALGELKAWLDAEQLYVFTLNGFPYGSFHHQGVKDQVYAPDWSRPERLSYTLGLADVLAALLPEGMDGGISTLPLSYKPWWFDQAAEQEAVLQASTRQLARVVTHLAEIRGRTGKVLHLDLEPEPDGLIENAVEVVDYFERWLLPVGAQQLQRSLGLSADEAASCLREHVRICYDTCHFAVEYEQPAEVFRRFEQAGIQVGKIQISAAIQTPLIWGDRQLVRQRLAAFVEATYLHQVVERRADGTLRRYRDLAEALPHLEATDGEEWRTHFHVPIFIHDYQTLQSTQSDIQDALEALPLLPTCRHLEIETYTWDVLPPAMKIDLLSSIEREYRWVLGAWAEGQIQGTASSDRLRPAAP
ncbi:MAG: metabolite traffic protein EboE [Elainellaceae cyanobacterium]